MGFLYFLATPGGFTLTELLVVVGIFTLLIGVSFTLLSTGRFSVNLTEAEIQATEHAREAMNQIGRELRLSRVGAVLLSDNVAWTTNNNSGTVVNFQIPVGSYASELDLTNEGAIRWGSEDTIGAHIAYSLNAASQLIRSTYTASNGSDTVSRIVTTNISSLTFNRTTVSSNLITMEVIGQAQTPAGRVVTQTLSSSVKLRN